MEFKYFKPFSVTWWASAAPALAGTFVATEPMHQLTEMVQSVNNLTGGMAPAMLINMGLFGIGLRGSPGVTGALGLSR